ncbi:MAG: ABC transporter ATP-binding protein/permease [Clostridia bacterium]|nr:ABC transporter ATP-binding protein/permease [Clostridia bacterium]
MLKLLNITKEYRIDDNDVTLALNNVSIEFRQNEFVSILGPSGCGKTTLLNIVGGLDRYTSGDIQVDGVSTKEFDDVDWDTYRNQRIGFVFQSYNLIPHMNILKNVALCLTLAGVSKEERIERAMEALRKVGLADQAKKRPNQLSGGQAQRVAIARALVNNPDIILADEPTGALDTESGLQIMELLKEVASDRLVVMVTHNPQLAEEYSTRIVYLKDGEVVGDTMPYDGTAEEAEEVAVVDAVEEARAETPAPKKATFKDKMKKLSEKIEKFKKHDKASMKLSTAISLSWNNLISKKGRTFLTSVAGSIGIIGIILVLSLSSGASAFIASMEEDALSTYPLTVNKSSLQIEEVLSKLMSGGEACNEHVDANSDGYCDQCNVDINAGYDVTVLSVLGELIPGFVAGEFGAENDLHSFKKYIDENFDDAIATVKYDYGTTFNVYAEDPKNSERPADEQIYMKINPYVEAMFIVLEQMRDNPMIGAIMDTKFNIFGMEITMKEALPLMGSMLGDSWAEMSTNQELLDSQYDVKAGRWPSSKDEVVVVLTRDGKLIDFQLFMLGLKSQDDVTQALVDGKTFSSVGFKYEELLGKSYKVLTNADYLIPNVDADGNPIVDAEGNPTWAHMPKSTLDKDFIESNASMDVKIVGVVQPKEGANALSISGVVGYTKELGDYLLEKAETHEAVQAQIAAYEKAVAEGKNSYKSVLSYTITNGESTDELKVGGTINIKTKDRHDIILRALGVADLDYPLAIKFFCSSFDSKDAVEAFIKDYNEKQTDPAKEIQFSDSLSTMMSFVNTMAEVITGVLVAFAAISLVVSTIMIAIIIYTSVLERRKEIGVLRSIGARKKDVARVFLAESAILGGYSGVIGVVVSCLISLAGSAILKSVFGIANIMQVEWWHAVMMLGISVVLSMLAGFVPSRVTAKKDPAIALRSE